MQLDVLRVGKSNTYRCYLRLGSRSDKRVCIFEASRTRKGKLKNSQYLIHLPRADPRSARTCSEHCGRSMALRSQHTLAA